LEDYRHLILLANRENAEAEIFSVKRDLRSIRVFNNEIVEAQNMVEEGAGIRIARDGRIGFAVTNNLSRDSLEKSFRSALSMAKTSSSIPSWRGFPAQQDHDVKAIAQGLQDKALASITPDETVELAQRMIREATSTGTGAHVLTGALITLFEEFSVLNSRGLEHLSETSPVIHSRIIMETRGGEHYCTAERRFCSRRLSDFRPEAEVDKVVSSISELLKLTRKRVSKGKHEVILSPESAGAFTSQLIGPMIAGKSVNVGASCLTNMLNRRVASESFSLLDNGRAEGGIASASVDDEGTPTRSTKVVEKGVLRNFLYDTVTAGVSGANTTGNARRVSDAVGRSYSAPPEPLATNLAVECGDFSFDELIEETKSGLIIDSIGYTFHLVPERGYFNIVNNVPVLVVENGQIEGQIRKVTISGELVETLMKIDGIGKEDRQSAWLGSMVAFSPHLRIKDMNVENAG
jgi:PmbA protein